RLARMFKGFRGDYYGVDVDHELVAWADSNLSWVQVAPSLARKALDIPDRTAECVISVSVFTHMNETDCAFYLAELKRLTKKGGYLFLTVHGERALERALTERRISDMLSIPTDELQEARRAFDGAGFHFARQSTGHLTTAEYDYGITFISRKYLEAVW